MGYTRVVKYGNITETYEYENKIIHTPRFMRKPTNRLARYRRKRARESKKPRSEYSARRARFSFYRIVCENLARRGIPLFITLTYKEPFVSLTRGYRHIYEFKKAIKVSTDRTITYIAVPEWQKKRGTLHYHLLVWNYEKEWADIERTNRNLQRCWSRGFVDVRIARDDSPKIANYLAKYMSKAYKDRRLAGRRAYTLSRDAFKPSMAGSNTMSSYLADIVDFENTHMVESKQYEVPYLGTCVKKIYKNKK